METIVGPLADRLDLAGKMDLTITLEPAVAAVLGKNLRLLARHADASASRSWHRKQFTRSVAEIVAFFTFLALLGAWLS